MEATKATSHTEERSSDGEGSKRCTGEICECRNGVGGRKGRSDERFQSVDELGRRFGEGVFK